MFFKPAIKAPFFLSLSEAAHASVIPGQGNQLELAQQLQMAEQLRQLEQAVIASQPNILKEAEQEEFDGDDESKSPHISYGKCYHIATSSKTHGHKDGNYLARNPQTNAFELAGRESAGIFEVCKLTGSCTPNQPNKVVQDTDEFSLYHYKGYSKNYIISANSKWECFDKDDCPVRLRAKDQTFNFDGITVNPYNKLLIHTAQHESLVLYFEETRCSS